MRSVATCLILAILVWQSSAGADDAKSRIDQVISAIGGEEKLLSKFEFRERVLITDTPAAPPTPDEMGNRTSVVEVGKNWWLGTKKRDKDKVRVLCWAWSLQLLREPTSKIEEIPDTKIGETAAFGLRVTESIAQPLTLHFDAQSHRLLAIDYTDTRHIFSEWKTTDAGHHYAAHVTGYRFADAAAGTLQAKQWYQTDILELKPLAELPEGLK